jgi:L-arabinose isomerase
MINQLSHFEVWFLTGSQHLYGPETLEQVASDSSAIVEGLNNSDLIPVRVIFKPVLKTPSEITNICKAANNDEKCIGLITWMHTFSPAKMWIAGLKALNKPILHLHTQFNREIPWDKIDMDFMNLNQSAHGGREYGFMLSRMRINRKVIVGFWQDEKIQKQVAVWMRSAAGWNALQNLKVVRFGDNMREVAVTEGDKVEAQIKLGFSVYGYGVGDLAAYINKASDKRIKDLLSHYQEDYNVSPEIQPGGNSYAALKEAARIEAGLRDFLEDGGFGAFTTNFEDLHGLVQLPGLAVQRLMRDGYGFGAEGDWKTAAMVHAVKVMAEGLPGGTSFMEDYTYHFDPAGGQVLGAHMLEVCESIADSKPSLEIHPLGIGGKADPLRLVFNVPTGPALNASLMDMGNRFRLLVNTVDVVSPPADLPELPVARALWVPHPNLETGAAAWIYAGGAHHTVFSQAISPEYLENLADMAGIEMLLIDGKTDLSEFRKEIRMNEVYYLLNK